MFDKIMIAIATIIAAFFAYLAFIIHAWFIFAALIIIIIWGIIIVFSKSK
jgi:hypothetical protein